MKRRWLRAAGVPALCEALSMAGVFTRLLRASGPVLVHVPLPPAAHPKPSSPSHE